MRFSAVFLSIEAVAMSVLCDRMYQMFAFTFYSHRDCLRDGLKHYSYYKYPIE